MDQQLVKPTKSDECIRIKPSLDKIITLGELTSEPQSEGVESSHIERVSSFVRKHRNSFTQNRQTWISSSSILTFKDKKQNLNSSLTAADEKQVIESPDSINNISIVLDNLDTADVKDSPQYTPENYGKLLFHGNVDVQQSEIVSILGRNDAYHISVLKSYINEFNFSEMDIDDAFRKVCKKIDILGETQVIDRLLFQISQRYWDCNEKMRDVFLSVDITYGILFSLVLLNTDLNIANVGLKQNHKMTKKDFLKNTMDLVISMIENNQELKEISKSDSSKRDWKKNLQSLLKNYYSSVRNKGFTHGDLLTSTEPTNSFYNLSRNNSSWSLSSGMSSASYFSAASSSTSSRTFLGFKGFLHRSIRPAKSLDQKLSNNEYEKIYEGVVIRKHMLEKFDQKARNRRWFKSRLILKMNDSGVKLVILPYDGKKLRSSDPSLPPTGPSAYQFKLTSDGPEKLDLLHAVAEPLRHMSYSVKRPHVFSVRLGNGSTYLFQVPSLESKETWAHNINYCAASRSKEPLRDVLSSIDYGWNKIEWAIKKAQLGGETVDFSQLPCYIPSEINLNIWERPIHNFRNALVSNLDAEKQINNFESQISIIKRESELHEQYKHAIEIMYPDSSVKELAISNWSKKKAYLDSEINKYTTYIEALKNRHNAKTAPQLGVSPSLQRVLEF